MKLDEVADTQQNFIIFVDMDGVVANFKAGITKVLGKPYSEERYRSDSKYRSAMWKAVKEYSKKGGKLWYELPEMDDARHLWHFVEQYNHEILSATGNPPFGAADQKRQWIKEKFGSVKVNLVRMSKEKAQYAKPNHILIDDQPKSINPWKEAGGIGILHKNAATTIAELKKILNNED